MSKISKGNYYENKARDTLRKWGYKVEKPVRTKFSRKDFFDLFDLFAIRELDAKLIQVKLNRWPSGELVRKLRAFKHPRGIKIEAWRYKKHKGFSIREY